MKMVSGFFIGMWDRFAHDLDLFPFKKHFLAESLCKLPKFLKLRKFFVPKESLYSGGNIR